MPGGQVSPIWPSHLRHTFAIRYLTVMVYTEPTSGALAEGVERMEEVTA